MHGKKYRQEYEIVGLRKFFKRKIVHFSTTEGNKFFLFTVVQHKLGEYCEIIPEFFLFQRQKKQRGANYLLR